MQLVVPVWIYQDLGKGLGALFLMASTPLSLLTNCLELELYEVVVTLPKRN